MNEFFENKYLKSRKLDFKNYSIDDFLYNETAVEKCVDLSAVMLAVCGLLIMSGFDIHLRGTHYLTQLTVERSVNAWFSLDETIERIAREGETDSASVIAEIDAALKRNSRFGVVMSSLLGEPVGDINGLGLADITEIVVAAFKIYYNYVTDESVAQRSVGNEQRK